MRESLTAKAIDIATAKATATETATVSIRQLRDRKRPLLAMATSLLLINVRAVTRNTRSTWMYPVAQAFTIPHTASRRRFTPSQTSLFSSNPQQKQNPKKKPSKPKPKSKKIKINPNWQADATSDRISAAFEQFVKTDGMNDADVYTDGGEGDSEEALAEFMAEIDGGALSDAEMAGFVAREDELDLEEEDLDDEDDMEDDFLDFGEDMDDEDLVGAPTTMTMAERIAEAKRDLSAQKALKPNKKDKFFDADLPQTDSKPDKEKPDFFYTLIENAMECTACGSKFQSRNVNQPGFLPEDKYALQVKLAKLDEAQKLQNTVDGFEWSPEQEVDWLVAQETSKDDRSLLNLPFAPSGDVDLSTLKTQLDIDPSTLPKRDVICQRCHNLQFSGKVTEELRPGWTEEPQLSQESFLNMLQPIRNKPEGAVVVALIDLFDFSGSVLSQLDEIAGTNPVIIAANKADLLPSELTQLRGENWVRRELEYLGIQSLANVGGAVRLISCKTGFGVTSMIAKARELAEKMGGVDVYVVGAANAGKSTLMNRILEKSSNYDKNTKKPKSKKDMPKKRAGNANQRRGKITTSPLPGTTLKFIKADIGNGISLYDTPGLLVKGTLTQLLTLEELKIVVPKKKVEPVTFRVAAGKCVLVGGLAKIELVDDCKPFLFTFFVANEIKLHPTSSAKADEVLQKHVGTIVTPPLSQERYDEFFSDMESHTVTIDGAGWKEAAADITLRGLGWVAVTGSGMAKVKITVPKGIGVSVRPPLMPYDVWDVAARYTGGRAVRKQGKTRSGKYRKGVGRR